MAEGQQQDGCFPRVNGGMIQTGAYIQYIVSIVGKIVAADTLVSSDGTMVKLSAEYYADGALPVNPDMCVEVMGQVADETRVTVRGTTK